MLMKSLVKSGLIYSIIAVMLFLTACKVSKNDEPIVVSNGITNIKIYENINEFTEIMDKLDKNDLVYVADKKEISIKFNEEIPEDIHLSEYIIDENGNYKYSSDTAAKSIDVSMNGNEASFTLEPNIATLLSSNSNDYEKGATLKGYRMICEWKDGESEYLFVIKSDAAFINEE